MPCQTIPPATVSAAKNARQAANSTALARRGYARAATATTRYRPTSPGPDGCSQPSVPELTVSSAIAAGCARGMTGWDGIRVSTPPASQTRTMSDMAKQQAATVMTSPVPCSPGRGPALATEALRMTVTATPIGAG